MTSREKTVSPPTSAAAERGLGVLTTKGSPLTASMMRDLENKNRIEADHIVGDLLRRGKNNESKRPLLLMALAHLQSLRGEARARAAEVRRIRSLARLRNKSDKAPLRLSRSR